MKKRRLKTIEDVRRALAAVYCDMESRALDPAVGTKLAYVANIIGRLIENGDIEQRLEKLEQLEDQRHG